MRRRRRIAALFALIALVLSFVETARASVCEESAATTSHEHHNMPADSHDSAPVRNESMPECPLGMAWQVGCAPTASLPTHNAPELVTASITQAVLVGDVVIPHATRVSAIFHPPRV